MNGLGRLWKNELIKIRRQTANKVIIIIVLVLALLVPVFSSLLARVTEASSSFGNEDYWQEEADRALEFEDYDTYCYFSARLLSHQFFESESISENGWRYDLYYENYTTLIQRKLFEGLYLDGKIDKDYFADNMYWRYGITNDIPLEYDDDGMPSSDWIDSFDVRADYEDVEKQIAEIEDVLRLTTLEDYARDHLISLRDELKNAKTELGDLKNLYSVGKATQSQVQTAELTVEGTEFMISFYESIARAKVKDERDENWRIAAVDRIGSTARQYLAGSAIMSEDEFNEKNDAQDFFGIFSSASADNYKDYVEMTERSQKEARQALMTVDYALANGIAPSETVERSTKSIVHYSLGMVASLISLAMVIITAMNVAGEYSSGTIRLLLIRPRNRSKIIASKFLALFTVCAFFGAVGFVTSNIVPILINGVSDIFVPNLMCSANVFEIPAVVYSLLKMLLPLLSGSLLGALAFFMAVWTRKAALAIIAPVIVNAFSSTVQLVVVTMLNVKALRFTILPYFDLGVYLSTPLANYNSMGMDGVVSMFFGDFSTLYRGAGISILIGVVVVTLHLVLLYILAFEIFRRQQIKN